MVTQSKQHIRRTVPLRVKISPEVSARLDAIALPRGLTPATMGALAVGEFVERYERNVLEVSSSNHSPMTSQGLVEAALE